MTTPKGCRTRLLDLRPGDCVCLPVNAAVAVAVGVGEPAVPEPSVRKWSTPVTITGVLLIDTELVQVRWSPERGQDLFAAHLLLTGPAYHAGAIRCRPNACRGM